MSIRVTCPSCHTAAACPDEYRGRALRCKKCGRSFTAGAPAAASRPAPPTGGKPARGHFLLPALLAGVGGVAVILLVVYFLMTRNAHPDGVAAGFTSTAAGDTGPAPANTGKREPPRDTAAKPPPAANPVAWQDFTSRDWGFSARFPGAPQTVSRPGTGGRRTQVFLATVPLSPDGKQAQFTIACTDCDPRETADAAAFLAAAVADVAGEVKEKTPLKLDGFPGVELRAEKKDADGPGVWLATRRVYVVRSRLYDLYAGSPRDQGASISFKPFFDSFALLDVGPSSSSSPPPPPVQAPRDRPATQPKGGLAELQLTVPGGWQANYNKFLPGWVLTKPPPTVRSEGEEARIEECPADARVPADYAAHLKEKDFLNVDLPGWVEVGKPEELPDGFVIKGVVKKFGNPKTPPVLGLLVVREIAGLKVRCFSANLRSGKSRDEVLEMFKGATFGPAK